MEYDFAYNNFLTQTRSGLSIIIQIIGLAYMAISFHLLPGTLLFMGIYMYLYVYILCTKIYLSAYI